MAEMWKRTLSFLGLLGNYDDEYDDVDYDDLYEDEQPTGPPGRSQAPASALAGHDEPTNVRRIAPSAPAGRAAAGGRAHDGVGERGSERLGPRDSGSSRDSRDAGRGSKGSVRASTVHVTNPTTFNDVEEVGQKFRSGVPVIMNLASASESVAKRLLDFASGLIFGLDGRIERVGDRVFLLTPVGTEVSSEERNRLSESGFFNQA
jgi:cell division inhibitor SepF